MNSAFSKVSNLKLNRLSKIAITLTSSTFFLYALGQAPILKNIIASAFFFWLNKIMVFREAKKLK